MVCPVLRLQQDSSALQALQAVPLAFLYIQHNPTGYHIDGGGEVAVVIVEVFLEMAADADAGLAGAEVAVDGHRGAGFDGVEHALGVVLGAVAEVEVAAQAGRGLGLGGQGV